MCMGVRLLKLFGYMLRLKHYLIPAVFQDLVPYRRFYLSSKYVSLFVPSLNLSQSQRIFLTLA